MPSVSVITPCYNYAHYLGATLDCLQSQSFEDWECVLVDDGSTDASPDVARQYARRDARIRYLRKENGGLPAARNTGLGAAQGRYVFFLDADDLIHRDALSWLMKAMANRSRRVCLMRARNFLQDPARDGFPFEARPRAMEFLPNILADNLGPPHCYLAERRAILAAGSFDAQLRACEDWDLWIRMAVLGAELVNVDRVGAYYRRHATSMSAGKFRMWEAALRVRWKAFRQFTPDNPSLDFSPEMKRVCRRTIATHLKRDWIRLAAKLAHHRQVDLAGQFLELAREPATPPEARLFPGELWALYGLHRVTRPCPAPTPTELDQLHRLAIEMRDNFTTRTEQSHWSRDQAA
jgi:GT2 family glycosyltransferase